MPLADRNIGMELIRVTEAAAIASARLMGRGDAEACSQAATKAMMLAFRRVELRAEIIIGEPPSRGPGPLSAGEFVGGGIDSVASPSFGIAVGALEGRRLCATGLTGAISVLALAPIDQLCRVPETYMEKITVGPSARGSIDLSLPPTDNLRRIAGAKGVYIDDLTVCVLDRPRHEGLIAELREAGARIRLIRDGDVAAAVATCIPNSGIDVMMGVGGAQEGVLSAAAIRCAGGELQGRLVPHDDASREACEELGLAEKIFCASDLAAERVVFAATGVTGGALLRGVRFGSGGATSQSLVMRSASNTIRFIETTHNFDHTPNYEGD